MTHQGVVDVCNCMARAVEIPADRVAAHSLRRGGATYAFQAGVPEVLVQRQGGWLSACYKHYLEVPKELALSCVRRMLDAVSRRVGLHEMPIEAVQPADHLPAAADRGRAGGTL